MYACLLSYTLHALYKGATLIEQILPFKRRPLLRREGRTILIVANLSHPPRQPPRPTSSSQRKFLMTRPVQHSVSAILLVDMKNFLR